MINQQKLEVILITAVIGKGTDIAHYLKHIKILAGIIVIHRGFLADAIDIKRFVDERCFLAYHGELCGE